MRRPGNSKEMDRGEINSAWHKLVPLCKLWATPLLSSLNCAVHNLPNCARQPFVGAGCATHAVNSGER